MLAKLFIPKSSEWQLFGKQFCVLFDSTRPKLVGRGNCPISHVKVSFNPIECPVLGEQFDIMVEPFRPLAAKEVSSFTD
jgi:hypothetical protein